MKLTDISAVKRLCRQYGIKPSALAGQNFLIDESVLAAIVASAAPRSGESVLEIGAGLGALTKKLLDAGVRLLAVEKDKKLAGFLAARFGQRPNFKLIVGDILGLDNQAIQAHFQSWIGGDRGGRYRVISNLPYHITGKVIRKFVSDQGAKPSDMVVLLQKEVAERICARPGGLSLLAVAVQLYGRPKIEVLVPKTSFWPIPKVDSALVKIEGISAIPRYPMRNIQGFWRILRIGFSSPRKQLRNNLAAGLGLPSVKAAAILEAAGLSAQARAQEVEIEQWIGLVDAIDELTGL
jgi:16S rRNA (adenine1518-N6/adenine1519-N6)-dimethyltransferase